MKLKPHLFFMIVIAFIFANTSNATTYTAVQNGQWDSTSTWDVNGVPDNLGTADVVIPDNDTVTIDANFTINNLTVGGGSSGCLQYSKTYGATTVVNGNILVQAGAIFKVQTNTLGVGSPNGGLAHSLDLKGNLTDNGSSLDFRSGTAGTTLSVCNLTLSGTINSTLTINTPYSTTNGDFNGVTINKTGGAKVILGSSIAVSGGSTTGPAICNAIMTFVSGIIETGSYIWICQTSTGASVLGYSAASYVNGAMGRGMSNTVGSSKEFPVGDANGYELFTLRSTTSGAATGHYAIVRCIPGNANTGSSSLLGGIDKVSQVRYFQVSYNQLLGSGAASMNFDRFWPSYTYDDGVAQGNTNLRVAYSTNTRATWNGMGQLSNPHTTKHSMTPPTQIKPDSLASPVTLSSGGNSIYLAIARVSGSTENTLQASVVLHPTVLLEAMWVSGGEVAMTMTPAVTVELRDASTYALIESQTSTLTNLGVGYFTFSTAVNSTPYYIVIKSANTIEAWSADPQSFASSFLTYNFTTGVDKAYTDGSNPSLALHNLKYCIYSGDVNQDGFVTGDDFEGVDNDAANFDYHLATDVNGDGFTTGDDFQFIDNNAALFVQRQVPPGAPSHLVKGDVQHKSTLK